MKEIIWKKVKVLAFMQNPWFPVDTKKEHVDRYITDQEFHQRILARSMSGGRLLQAFGPTMFGKIWWDNVAPAAAVEAAGKTDIDMIHVERIISEVKPGLILTFGNLAKDALEDSIQGDKIPRLHCHHPNARHKTMADLGQFGVEVSAWLEERHMEAV